MRSHAFQLACMSFLAACTTICSADGTKLLRYPDIHGDRVVFTYAGDLWTAPSVGGTASRVTAHEGLELFAKFSPDGQQLAFTGQYDGDEQVYVTSAGGGVPRQLTFYPAKGPLPDRWGFDNQVYGWTPDGTSVLFRSLRQGWTLTDSRLYTVGTDGGLPRQLPMRVSGVGDFSPDGTHVVFSPLTRDFRTWKRYEGGWAQDLYTIDLKTLDARKITGDARTDRDPMWIGDRIYFASDRNGTLNLFYYDLASGETVPVTTYDGQDVRWPSKGGDEIVYELGGELHIFDTRSGEDRKLDITVPADQLAARPHYQKVSPVDYSASPGAKRVAFVGRGDMFSVPSEKGVTRNLTASSGAHDKAPDWSPDGKRIAFLSDASGEEELYTIDAKGAEPPVRLTSQGNCMRYQPLWSPDSRSLAISDKDGRLAIVSVADQSIVEIANDKAGRITDYTWSPCSQFLAFSLTDATKMKAVHIYDIGNAKVHRITGDRFSEYEPVWDPQGKYLYYLSDREFAPQIGNTEWNYVRNRTTGVFALALSRETPHPYPPIDDEVGTDEEKDTEDEDDDERDGKRRADDKVADAKNKKQDQDESEDHSDEEETDEGDDEPTRIDWEGLAERVAAVPIEAGNLAGLDVLEGYLLYIRSGAFYYGRESNESDDLCIFSHEEREESVLASDVESYDLSPDGEAIVYESAGDYFRIDAAPESEPEKIDTSEMAAEIDPRQEWRQIFHEVWRRFRDFFYVENMHGYDWEQLRAKYEPLLEHVAHRSDLNYVIGEMIAELNVGHAYKAGGDFARPDRPNVALLGAVLELDDQAGRYRLAHIFRGENEEDRYRSPLREIGVDVREGEYLLAIDGKPLTASENPYKELRHKVHRPVNLLVNDKPLEEGARQVTIRPVADESSLVYLNWVLDNYDKVDKAAHGAIGYIHLPDMGEEGIYEFNKWFYGQIRKQGLIIDVRSNGGGNVSQMVIDRLRRALLATGFERTSEYPNTYPEVVFHGHLVCLLDEDSASDGDIFPAMFRQAKLGPLIGKRSWGGVIGITNRGTLIDGGLVFVPEFGFSSTKGEWIIEGHGVDPDIEVENDPKSLIEGRDPQLERAIEEITREVQNDPKSLPSRPAPPVKTP